MGLRFPLMCVAASALWFSSGCCTMHNSCGSCGVGGCGPHALAGHGTCSVGCGERYVDEWINEPPCIDDCGPSCGPSCGHCGPVGGCQPIRSILRALWGTRYPGCGPCGSDFASPSCASSGGCAGCGGSVGMDGGCSTCGGGGGVPHSMASPPIEIHNAAPQEHVPTPAPHVPTSSARRLNPAQQRQLIGYQRTSVPK